MKSKILILFFLFSAFFYFNTSAQVVQYYEPFDSTLNGWVSPGSIFWTWGDQAILLGQVYTISAPSGAGTAVLQDTSVVVNSNTLISEAFDFSLYNNVRLRFNQLLHLENTNENVFVRVKSDIEESDFPLNLNSNWNGTTNSWDLQDIDITAIAAGQNNVLVSFMANTSQAVWIIDDIKLYEPASVGETLPIPYLGDSLKNYNIPYDIGDDGWPYVPYQVVVDFAPNVPESRKQELRDSFGFRKIMSCHCSSDIELWVEDGDAMDLDIIGIQEKTEGSGSGSDIDDIELNKYNFNHLFDTIPPPVHPLKVPPSGLTKTPKGAVLIAVLDTGIDYNHIDLTDHIWQNPNLSWPDSCSMQDDFIGWNFVHDNNNPMDDHSHGTHVAGIIVQNLKKQCTESCDYRLIPLKTHNANGVGNLFDVTCATYYSIDVGVDIINDSWGFYGNSSRILKTAMENAENHNILIVSAAGNDSLNLGITPQFPACDTLDNIVTVGSHDIVVNGNYQRSWFSNYSPSQVDLLALGDQVVSAFPGNLRREKSGTSMATPAVTAAYVAYFCGKRGKVNAIKNALLSCTREEPKMAGKDSEKGRVLDYGFKCDNWWDRFRWPVLAVGLFLLIYMSVCWGRTKTLFRYRKN
ncbi:MAG: S8 family serine peptidase [Saprospiraceae bacterium]|nr:S8 family serine peptidase [Saprospiraceae bacterium]MCB9325810.1 S8 family serine peptidase [Lewinellaceae bacterium]